MTAQEIFDKVCSAMIEQGRPAFDRGACSYRGYGGTKCAVGCLIPDERYHRGMEGRGLAFNPEVERVLTQEGILDEGKNMAILISLQSAHDQAGSDGFVENFIAKAREVAQFHDLETDVLDKATTR